MSIFKKLPLLTVTLLLLASFFTLKALSDTRDDYTCLSKCSRLRLQCERNAPTPEGKEGCKTAFEECMKSCKSLEHTE